MLAPTIYKIKKWKERLKGMVKKRISVSGAKTYVTYKLKIEGFFCRRILSIEILSARYSFQYVRPLRLQANLRRKTIRYRLQRYESEINNRRRRERQIHIGLLIVEKIPRRRDIFHRTGKLEFQHTRKKYPKIQKYTSDTERSVV